MNNVNIIGNMVRDPEARRTNSGTMVCRVSIACNRKYKDTEEVSFFDVDVWGKTAEFVSNYLRKGNRVAITGRLKQEQWEDQSTGSKRSRVLIVAEQVQGLDKKDENGGSQSSSRSSASGSSGLGGLQPLQPTNLAETKDVPVIEDSDVPEELPGLEGEKDESIDDQIPF